MARHLEAWINGASLRDVAGGILIKQIYDEPPRVDVAYAAIPGADGQRVLSNRRTNRRVTITAQVRELYDLAARARAIDAINAWAADGWLEINSRPDQRLRVVCVTRPAQGNLRDYTSEFAVAFEAAAGPYWQEKSYSIVTASGSSGSAQLSLNGSEPAFLEAEITPAANLATLDISAGGCAFHFTGMPVTSGTKITIGYDDQRRLFVRAGATNTSILRYRTAASSDDIILAPGAKNTIAFSAGASCAWTFKARGLWR